MPPKQDACLKNFWHCAVRPETAILVSRLAAAASVIGQHSYTWEPFAQLFWSATSAGTQGIVRRIEIESVMHYPYWHSLDVVRRIGGKKEMPIQRAIVSAVGTALYSAHNETRGTVPAGDDLPTIRSVYWPVSARRLFYQLFSSRLID